MKFQGRKLALSLLVVSLTSGCYKATFVEDQRAVQAEPTHEEWTDHYVFGLVGDEEYDTRDYCANGTSAVRTGGNVGTVAVTAVTIGIYAPRKVYVTCRTGPNVANNSMPEKTQ